MKNATDNEKVERNKVRKRRIKITEEIFVAVLMILIIISLGFFYSNLGIFSSSFYAKVVASLFVTSGLTILTFFVKYLNRKIFLNDDGDDIDKGKPDEQNPNKLIRWMLKIYKKKWFKKISLLFIFLAFLVIFYFTKFNKPLYLHGYGIVKNTLYLKIDEMVKDEIIDFSKRRNEVRLDTRGDTGYNKVNYYLECYSPTKNVELNNFSKIFLNVLYSKGTEFYNDGAMLKLSVNGFDLVPTNTKDTTLIEGSGVFLLQAEGNFFFEFKSDYLSNGNRIVLTLGDEAKLDEFYFEIALIP